MTSGHPRAVSARTRATGICSISFINLGLGLRVVGAVGYPSEVPAFPRATPAPPRKIEAASAKLVSTDFFCTRHSLFWCARRRPNHPRTTVQVRERAPQCIATFPSYGLNRICICVRAARAGNQTSRSLGRGHLVTPQGPLLKLTLSRAALISPVIVKYDLVQQRHHPSRMCARPPLSTYLSRLVIRRRSLSWNRHTPVASLPAAGSLWRQLVWGVSLYR